MASTTCADWPGQRLDHATFARELAARREVAGNPVMPRNAGTRRTESKRAMLSALKDLGADW